MGGAIFVGIDPGKEGAVAALREDGSLLHAALVPLRRDRSYDHFAMADVVAVLADRGAREGLTVLEHISYHRQEGGAGAGLVGLIRNAGVWEGMLAAYAVPHELVAPQTWQGAIGCPRFGKEDGTPAQRKRKRKAWLTRYAAARWRDLPLGLVKHQGLADAAILADHARRSWTARQVVGQPGVGHDRQRRRRRVPAPAPR